MAIFSLNKNHSLGNKLQVAKDNPDPLVPVTIKVNKSNCKNCPFTLFVKNMFSFILCIFVNIDVIANTVEPLYSGHHWFFEMVSAIERCPL